MSKKSNPSLNEFNRRKPRVIDLSLPAQGWQQYLAAKTDTERRAVELTDDDATKLVLLNLGAGKHPLLTTETLDSWKRNEEGRVVAEVSGPTGLIKIICE